MRVLVLTSSTGGGHNMRARSFKQWAERRPDLELEITIHQALERTHPWLGLGVWAYNVIQRRAPWLHQVYFRLLEWTAPTGSAWKITGRERFDQLLDDLRPDVVLSVHAHLNHGFFELARRRRPGVRCVTYCGELFGGSGFSRHWVNPAADLFIGAVDETFRAARRLGMPSARTVAGGFLLHPAFWAGSPSRSPRTADEPFKLLLSTSGETSANNHPILLDGLLAGLSPALLARLRVIALCGRGPLGEATLARVRAWAAAHPQLSVEAQPFVDSENMARLLRRVDAVVIRPGTGATSEAVLCGCPILFNGVGGVMPQEGITLRWARRHGFYAGFSSPAGLAQAVRGWMEDPAEHGRVHGALTAAQPGGHPDEILSLVTGLTRP